MWMCIRMTELLSLSRPKQTLLLRCVWPCFSMYLSNQIIWRRRSNRITIAMMLTSPRVTLPKLSLMFGPTQPHLRTCRQRQTV